MSGIRFFIFASCHPLNLDNINRLPHSKYPDRKNQEICRSGNRTHDLLRAKQMPKPLDQRLPRIYRSETDVLKFLVSLQSGHCFLNHF